MPPRCRRVYSRGSTDLTDLLAAFGFEIVEEPSKADVMLVELTRDAEIEQALIDEAREVGFIALAVTGETHNAPEAEAPVRRAAKLAGSPLDALRAGGRAREVAARLRASGFAVRVLPSGDRTRKYALGRRGWWRARRFPVDAVVVGAMGGLEPSVLDAAVSEAELALGRALEAEATAVFESGKLIVELTDGRAGYILRVGGGGAWETMSRSLLGLNSILSATRDPLLLDRVPAQLASGRVGLAGYTLEQRLAGAHPREMSPPVLEDCLNFLVSLHRLGQAGPEDTARSLTALFDADVQALEPYVDAPGMKTLWQTRARIVDSLHDAPLGWVQGDFWNENLLVDSDRLSGVLDWDWAHPRALGLLDCCDLITLSERRTAGLPPGLRLVHLRGQLAERGGHAQQFLRRYAELTGAPCDPESLEAVAVAHWLSRVARQLTPLSPRTSQPRWMTTNVYVPLAKLDGFGRCGALPPVGPRRRGRMSEDKIVLCYHAVSDTWPSPLAVDPQDLESQVTSLLERGYRATTFSEALCAGQERVVAVTFDDGYRSVYEHGYPVLGRLGVPASVFVMTDFADGERPLVWPEIMHWLDTPHAGELAPMNWRQLAELADAGWEIGSHTRSHPHLTREPSPQLSDELEGSRLAIEEQLGRRCDSLAYPFGERDARVVQAAVDAGYNYAASLSRLPHRALPLDWPRVGIYRANTALAYRMKVSPVLRDLARVADATRRSR